MFICNHCPVVLHMLDGLCDMAREYAGKGLQVVAISSNDPAEFAEAFRAVSAAAKAWSKKAAGLTTEPRPR